MTNQAFNQTNNPLAENVSVNQQRNLTGDNWTKYHTGALLGLLGGFIVLLGAIFLNVFDLFAGDKPHGIWLFIAIYPLFAIGSHCLDKISELKKQKENISPENTL
ncbi:MAG TPA: hypothetical protein VNB22_18365 [Pyrinomonadaceae bacterium]|nr:hypothetical protein [Pyrinomonadaceae bacterium]